DVATGLPLGPPLHHLHAGPGIARGFIAFSQDDRSVLTCGQTAGPGPGLERWEVVTAPVEGDVERITLWVQLLIGKELDSGGVSRDLDYKTWKERRQQLQEQGGPPLP